MTQCLNTFYGTMCFLELSKDTVILCGYENSQPVLVTIFGTIRFVMFLLYWPRKEKKTQTNKSNIMKKFANTACLQTFFQSLFVMIIYLFNIEKCISL
jgi:hypothetical protein